MNPSKKKRRSTTLEYILYCDESSAHGERYTDFFGGCIVEAGRQQAISEILNQKKADLGINAEIKWTKVSERYVEKYCELLHLFFHFVRSGDIRVRIMFRKKENQYTPAQQSSHDERYFKLYYQFLKHAFGFKTSRLITGDYHVHFFMDELPDHTAKADEFKRYLSNLPQVNDMTGTGLHIRMRDIGEVRSHDHVLLQCTDVILGSMQFRLNNLHKAIPEGQRRRGHKTVAKERVYKYIYKEICTIHPNFNTGESTGSRGYDNPHWTSPYEHWEFVPQK